jgi:glutaredoxin-like protein
MVRFLNEEDAHFVSERFEREMVDDVTVTLYTQPDLNGLLIPDSECETCQPTEQLLQEVGELSEKINLEVINYRDQSKVTIDANVDLIPTIIFSKDGETNVRYLGIPSGTEFPVLLDAIVNTSSGVTNLSQDTLNFLNKLEEEISIKVSVIPNRPYCPDVASLAHSMAIINDKVISEVIEVQEFPELSSAYNVRGVPLTVINGFFSLQERQVKRCF